MSRQRWWQRRPDLLEREKTELARVGFSLEQDRLDQGDVVFQGELRYGTRRHRAEVILPPAFPQGAQAYVRAPGIAIGRHITPEGVLCLDHPVAGELSALRGQEAVERAQELWRLWNEDRDQLTEREARAPEPHSHYTTYFPGSAVVLADVDVDGGNSGILRVGLTDASPYRGAVVGLRICDPDRGEINVSPVNAQFAGSVQAIGFWRRLASPPPGHGINRLATWAEQNHGDLLAEAHRIAVIERQFRRQPNIPELAAFVYPDETAWQEYSDEWLLLFTSSDGSRQLARAVTIGADDRFTRQPLLEPLSTKSVAIIGLGALGSTIASLLARAGVGRFVLADGDYLTAGNVVRHDLDLGQIGAYKALAMRDRLQRINPYVEAVGITARYGQESQAHDDEVDAHLTNSDLIVNAAANPSGIHEHIAAAGRERGCPVVHAWVGPGAWGARILVQQSGSGCPECFARHQAADPDAYPLEQGPMTEVHERGCADPTFTGAGFDLAAAAATTARAVVGVLVDDPERYPAPPDLLTLTMRTRESAIPTATAAELSIHPDCFVCNG